MTQSSPSSSARFVSLAYLTANRCTPAQAIEVAVTTGYQAVGLRLWPNAPGAPQQQLLGQPQVLRETLAAQADTGVKVFDLEIIRIDADFEPHRWDALFDAAAALKACAILVAADDPDEARLCQHYGRLCEVMRPYGLSADLEFMPWTAVKNAREALAVVRRAGQPSNAGILIDALHFARSDSTLDDVRAIPRELLHYAQICDATSGTHFSSEAMIHTARSERLLPGEGDIDLRGLFAALPSDLPVSVEVVHHDRQARCSPEQWARMCLQASVACW